MKTYPHIAKYKLFIQIAELNIDKNKSYEIIIIMINRTASFSIYGRSRLRGASLMSSTAGHMTGTS